MYTINISIPIQYTIDAKTNRIYTKSIVFDFFRVKVGEIQKQKGISDMSLFGEYLNQMIRGRGVPISRLAREAGVERTAIHKALNGDRILPYPAVESLVRYLKLSPGEAKKLHQYYNLLFESENAGRAREIVRGMFLRLSGQHFPGPEEWQNQSSGQLYCSRQDKGVYRGYGQIVRLIRSLMEEERKCPAPKIELALPPDMKAWEDCRDWFCAACAHRRGPEGEGRGRAGGRDMEFSHIVCLDAAGDAERDDLRNLEALSRLLPGCILPGLRYHIHYYYSDRGQARYTDPLPYFLVTHTGAACFSPDCQTALSFRTAEQIAYFHACFSHMKKSCHRLVEYLESPEAAKEAFEDIAAEGGVCAILPQPWLRRAQTEGWTVLFTRKGIQDFLKTGRQCSPFPGAGEAFQRNRRGRGLLDYLETLCGSGAKGRIVNDGRFAISRRLMMAVSAGGVFLCGDEAGHGIRIREGVLCRAVHDWVIHFSDSDDVFDREETIEILTEELRVWQSG